MKPDCEIPTLPILALRLRALVLALFRLPESLETEIYRVPPSSDDEYTLILRAALGHSDMLVEMLASLCGEAEMDIAAGAKRIGTDKDIMTAAGFKKTAAVYHHAFVRLRSET